MTPRADLRAFVRVAALGGVLGAGLTVALSCVETAARARMFAQRSAATIAAYLAFVTPVAGADGDYDLARLFVEARGLATMLRGTPGAEVYHGTAPLVDATAPPLTVAELARLRETGAMTWRRGAAVAPLVDRDTAVVGAVEVRGPRLGPSWPGGWMLLGFLAALVPGVASVTAGARGAIAGWPLRRLQAWYWAGGLALGIGAYADVRVAARQASDRWLVDTAALLQEAARLPGRPGVAALARILPAGELTSAADNPSRSPRAARRAVAVRLGNGGWAELRVPANDRVSGWWLLATLGAGLIAPAAASLAARRARSRTP